VLAVRYSGPAAVSLARQRYRPLGRCDFSRRIGCSFAVAISPRSSRTSRRRLLRTHSLTASLGGYIASESRDDRTVSVSMRVPEPKLDVALDSLSELGTVTSRSVSSQDVTEETIDVEARIQSLTAERDQLRALVQRASGLGDIFTIDRELARVQGEIDSLQHRLEHLRNSSALAELNAEFKKRREPGPVAAFFGAVGRGIGRLFVR